MHNLVRFTGARSPHERLAWQWSVYALLMAVWASVAAGSSGCAMTRQQRAYSNAHTRKRNALRPWARVLTGGWGGSGVRLVC